MYFLQGKPNQFLNWIQPILQYSIVKQDNYIYCENDEIESIYLL